MVLSIEERVFLVEYVFREGNRYTDLVQEQLLKNSQKHLYLIAMLFLDLLNKIKRVQACIDARGHHFQHLL
jgi:hypothetical protein